MLEGPVRVFVLQLDLRQEPVFETEKGPPQTRVDQSLDRPSLHPVVGLSSNRFRFGALQDLFNPSGRIIPAKAKWRRNFVRQTGGNKQRNKQNRRQKRLTPDHHSNYRLRSAGQGDGGNAASSRDAGDLSGNVGERRDR